MPASSRTPPTLTALLRRDAADSRPVAIVLAGHNGSGKSTLWYERLADELQMPLVNADRLTLSLLPPVGSDRMMKDWASRLRDEDVRWQKLSQEAVKLFMGLVMEQGMPFAFETVFSHLQAQRDGSYRSKIDVIRALQEHGYYVILLFVGLATADLSVLRVRTRKTQGGHDVLEDKIRSRFPRTQQAIRMASAVANLTLMFDNSRDIDNAFTLVRAQRREQVLYDCRDDGFRQDAELLAAADVWLAQVAPR
ncbi:zeta toxin family protein [Paludibaculum fermentans]|uniref:zeta toxin family protein n=1 Tax=Paludibaculum fermentans TaxID=1473598 RepID=UPI003EB7A6DB